MNWYLDVSIQKVQENEASKLTTMIHAKQKMQGIIALALPTILICKLLFQPFLPFPIGCLSAAAESLVLRVGQVQLSWPCMSPIWRGAPELVYWR